MTFGRWTCPGIGFDHQVFYPRGMWNRYLFPAGIGVFGAAELPIESKIELRPGLCHGRIQEGNDQEYNDAANRIDLFMPC